MILTGVPFVLMPVQQHLAAAAALVVLSMVPAALILKEQRHSTAQVKLELGRTLLEASNAQGARADSPSYTTYMKQFPTMSLTDQVTRDVLGFAQSNSVQVRSLTPSLTSPTAKTLGSLQLNLSATAEYGATKSWLAQLMDRYPALAVQSFTLLANSGESVRQEVALSLVLFLKP